jgi:hypothetical protein
MTKHLLGIVAIAAMAVCVGVAVAASGYQVSPESLALLPAFGAAGMINVNAKGSEITAVLEKIAPVSQGAGAVSSGWVSVKDFHKFLAVIQAGVLGAAATLDAKIQQASDNAGTGVKDVAGKAITQMVKATDDNKQAEINFSPADLDVNNGFTFVRMTLTVGTAASLCAAVLLGLGPRSGPASASNVSSVKEIVG